MRSNSLSRFVGLVFLAFSAVTSSGHSLASADEPAASSAEGSRVLRHVVFFKFKESTSQQEIDRVVEAFCALQAKIDLFGMQGFLPGKPGRE